MRKAPKLPASLSAGASCFVSRCLSLQPSLRPAAQDLLQDPFLSYESLAAAPNMDIGEGACTNGGTGLSVVEDENLPQNRIREPPTEPKGHNSAAAAAAAAATSAVASATVSARLAAAAAASASSASISAAAAAGRNAAAAASNAAAAAAAAAATAASRNRWAELIDTARRLRWWFLSKEGVLENSAVEEEFCDEWRRQAADQSRRINIIWPLVNYPHSELALERGGVNTLGIRF
jgi:hypothetical protein